MNFVGKILIFMIFIMSLVFMSFAIAVYATHENWRAVVERPREQAVGDKRPGLKFQLEDAQKANAELQAQLEKLTADVARQEAERKQEVAKLATKNQELTTANNDFKKNYEDLVKKDQAAVDTLGTQSKVLERITTEVEGLRVDIRNTQEQRDKNFNAVVSLTDEKHQAEGTRRRLEERRLQLANQVAAQKLVLERAGLNEFTPLSPPQVAGKIVAVNRNDMLEVDIGADDGIRNGYTLEIFRGAKYLGRMKVISTTADQAVGQILPNFKKGVIQKGDNVTTRFKLG